MRCARRTFLLGEGDSDRMQWIESRLQELTGLFSIAVGGFAVLDNHLHLHFLIRLDPQRIVIARHLNREAWVMQ